MPFPESTKNWIYLLLELTMIEVHIHTHTHKNTQPRCIQNYKTDAICNNDAKCNNDGLEINVRSSWSLGNTTCLSVLSNPRAGAETVRKTPSRALVAWVVNNNARR